MIKAFTTGMLKWNLSALLVFCMIAQLFPMFGVSAALIPTVHAAAFAHPGGWITEEDIVLVRGKLAANEQPWANARKALLASSPYAVYQPQPVPVVTREVGGYDPDGTNQKLRSEASYAYTLMVKWIATGDIGYANAAIRIIDGWSSTLTTITGFDAILAAAIYGNKFAQAAELAAYAVPDWPNKSRAQDMFRNVFYPLVKNGVKANWGTSAMACMISMGVFLDDRAMFDQAVTAFKAGFSNLRYYAGVTEYIDETGENAESGRDQGHSQGGVSHLLETAVVAYNHGINLFSYGNYRLVRGMEYLAKYNLGYDVPYHPFIIIDGPIYPNGISSSVRGVFSPIYEMANNYFAAAGVTDAVYTRQVTQSPGYAPEKTNFDQPGLGTLIFTVVPLRASQPAPETTDIPAGAYKLKNPYSGKYLEVKGAGTGDGTPVQIGSDKAVEYQRWIVSSNGDGTYQLADSKSGNMLATAGGGTDNGTVVQISDPGSGTSPRWDIVNLGDGTYKLVESSSHKALYAAGNGKTDGTPVQLWEDNGFYGQRWQLISDSEAPSTPTDFSAVVGSGSLVNLNWTASMDNVGIVGYAVYRDGVQVATTTSTVYTDKGLSAGTTYKYTVKAYDDLLNYSDASPTVEITTPAGVLFNSIDIGAVGLEGSYSFNNGTYTISASGSDIGNPTDEFRFSYIPMTGDGTIIARVASQQYTHAWAKAGVMIRESLDANSRYAAVVMAPGNGAAFLRRIVVGEVGTVKKIAGYKVPYWIKLERTGGEYFNGYISADGVNWTLIYTTPLRKFAPTVYVGLAVTSRDNTKLGTAVFDHVSIE